MSQLTLQEINISFLSKPDDYEAKDSAIIVEMCVINSYNKLEQKKYYLKGMGAEAAFSIFKDIIEGENKKDE